MKAVSNRMKLGLAVVFGAMQVLIAAGATTEGTKVPSLNEVGVGNKNSVLVVPTAEADGATQGRIHEYAREIRDRFYKGAEVISDTDALKRDLSQNTIVVYGTPAGNLWLAKYMRLLPVSFEKESVTIDKRRYVGMNLRMISVMRNPANPQEYARIHTAQRAEDVVGINSVFHGPTSWVVARGTAIEDQGDYYVASTWTSDPTAVGLEAPRIVKMEPGDGANDVDPVTTKELRVTFDQPMQGSYSWCQKGDGEYPSTPKGTKPYWSDDKTTCSLPVELKPGMTYRLYLNLGQYTGFRSKDGIALKSVPYSLSTKK